MLDPQYSPGEIKSREMELGSESWTCLLLQFLNSSVTDIVFVTLLRTAVETAIAECSSCFAMARLFWLSSATASTVFCGSDCAAEPLSPPPPPIPVPNKPPHFCGRKATCLLTFLLTGQTSLRLTVTVRVSISSLGVHVQKPLR